MNQHHDLSEPIRIEDSNLLSNMLNQNLSKRVLFHLKHSNHTKNITIYYENSNNGNATSNHYFSLFIITFYINTSFLEIKNCPIP